jgi:hypothetical protein
MRVIDEQLQSLLKNKNLSDLRHKVLLYRRKWDSDLSQFAIEETPIEITKELEANNTNGKIKFSLDTDSANVWKVANLILILSNDKNQFWQGKYDGYFSDPYLIYGSKIEYYIGSPTVDKFVKCFTGYLTESPNYRPDDNLVEIRVLSRLDWLKNISAEQVSTTITNEEATIIDSENCTTTNSAVGRITKVLKGLTIETATELEEKTDYSISQLNEYSLSAKLNLTSELLVNEKIFVSYIYWRKGIKIDELVEELLEVSGIDSEHRIIDNVIFQNALRVANETVLNNAWAWIYEVTADTLTHKISGGGGGQNTYDQYSYHPANHSFPSTKNISCKCLNGSFKFKVENMQDVCGISAAGGYFSLMSGSSFVLGFMFGGAGGSAVQDDVYLNFPSGAIKIADGVVGYTFEIEYLPDGTVKAYRNGALLHTTTTTPGLNITEARIFSMYNTNRFTVSNISARPTYETEYKNYPYCRVISQNDEVSFAGFDRFNATVSVENVPNPSIMVRYGTDSDNWTEFVNYTLNTAMSLNYNSAEFIIKNTASFGNKYNLSDVKLWAFITQDIPLGVCDLTNMSVFSALQALAEMSMYEIGFDADDKFFFRKRKKTASVKTLEDNVILGMSKVYYDIDRLATRVVVNYGGFNKVVDSETQGEVPPTNKDKYGNREKLIDGSQLLPANNVDLAYAIAPTVYAELSKIRLTLSVDILIDLELELGDYVILKHNNNLLCKNTFTDFTKWRENSIFTAKCKIVGIYTDFNRKTTTLDLIDYTEISDYPVAEGNEFMYELATEFDIKK